MPALTERPARGRTRETVFQLIRSSHDLTRAGLVSLTGLPMSTVANAVNALLTEGRIVATSVNGKGPGTGSGRPSVLLNASPDGEPTAAIDFGHGHIGVAIGNHVGEPVATSRVEHNVDLGATTAIDLAVESLQRLQHERGIDTLSRIVAGIPGPLDAATGRVCSATILSSWVGLDPAGLLQQGLGAPVHVENDAALGAYGELTAGAGRRFRDFIYVKASHGIGSGIVLNGQRFAGSSGIAGEIGHVQLAGRTELCRCGNRGCLEAVVSVESLLSQVNHTHPHHRIDDPAQIDLTDPVSRRLLDEAGQTVGQVLADLSTFLNPGAIIVGGELGAIGQPFLDGIRSAIDRRALPAVAGALDVVPAALGTDAELIGALHRCGDLLARA